MIWRRTWPMWRVGTAPIPVVPEELGGLVAELGRCTVEMAGRLEELLIEGSETGSWELDRADRLVDTIHAVLLEQVTADGWSHGVAAATELALLARFYERFADQVVSVARRRDFAATGAMPSRP